MHLNLDNRTVFITGGSRGIGLACARGFLAEGARVAIVGRSGASIEQARVALGQPGLCGVAADLSQPWRLGWWRRWRPSWGRSTCW